MKIVYACIILAVFLLSSCHGKRLSINNFKPISDLSELNGSYINEKQNLSRMFNIYSDHIDLININFVTKDSLLLSYIDTTGHKILAIRGEKKKNYFELFFDNERIYLPPILVKNSIDRLRIGKDENGRLLVYKWDEHYGMIILFAGGSTNDEYSQSFEDYDKKNIKESLYAVQINDKWGLIDSANNEIVPLIYDDFIIKHKDRIIKVRKDGKWGLIDFKNHELVATQYEHLYDFGDQRYPPDSLFLDLAEAHKDGKIGYINKQGVEAIPVVYDRIERYPPSYTEKGKIKYYRTQSEGKYGYISGNGILCKPIFDKAAEHLKQEWFSDENRILANKIGRYAEVIYKGEPYLFTENKTLYKYKNVGFLMVDRFEVDFDSKSYINE